MGMLKQKWLLVFIFGLALFMIFLAMLSFIPAFFPVVVIIGALLVPVTLVTYLGEFERGLDKEIHRAIPARIIVWCFVTAGVLGVGGAAMLEFATLKQLGIPQLFAVGLIEESVKMVIPLVFYFMGRYRSEADGLLFGITAGMGFAALETIGYGFNIDPGPQGGFGLLAQVLIARGLFSPANHAAWTGMVCAILWRERIKAGHNVLNGPVIGIFVLAMVLHASWDISSGLRNLTLVLLGYLVIAVISLGIIIWRMRETRGT